MATFFNDIDREPSVCVKAAVEGYLEKKPSGVFRSKTGKRWCWVQGTIFYQQKSNSNQGQGKVEVLDLSDAHNVKKVSADSTETQFEILMKDSRYNFVCPNRTECNAWVKALLRALTLKDSVYSSPSETEQDIYSSIDDGNVRNKKMFPSFKNKNKSVKDKSKEANNDEYDMCAEYCSPQDSVDNGTSNQNSEEENIYSMMDVPSSESISETKEEVDASSAISDKPPLPPRSEPETNQMAVYDDCYSMKGSSSSNAADNKADDVYDDAYSTAVKASRFIKNTETGHQGSLPQSSPMSKRVGRAQPHRAASAGDETNTMKMSEADKTEEDSLERLSQLLDSEMPAVADLQYILTDEDVVPLRELKGFLRNNEICHVSTNRISESQDPIAACKAYVASVADMI